jgi:transposase
MLQSWKLLEEGVSMLPRLLQVHPKTTARLIRLRKEAEQDGAYRVAKRLQAVILNAQGHSSGKVADVLQAPRSKVSQWLSDYEAFGVEGLLEGHRSGRPAALTPRQHTKLSQLLEHGPVAYGLDRGLWTSPVIAWVIEQEFGVHYHPGHVRKLLHALHFSVQRPRRVLLRANPAAQERWRRYTYPRLKKKSTKRTGR